MIEVDRISKTYQRAGGETVHALKEVSFRITPGEFVVVRGPSGSGKSTLMNILGCLDQPTSGAYRLDGLDVSALGRDALSETRNRRIGFVFQNYQLLARAAAWDNVALPLLYSSVPRSEHKDRAFSCLAAVGMQGRESQ